MNRLYAHGLSQEAKKTLLESLHKWAPQAILTKNVTEELLGIEVQERDLQFTQIWLELMKSDRTRRRTGNLSAEEVLNDGNYRVTGKLATGGQANLYLATNFDDEIVVLKEFILANNVADSAVSSLGEFEREFTILQRAANPSVPKLLDSFVEDSRAYLVLEFIDGPSLRSVVQARGRLPWTEVVPLAVQVCKALQFLHTLDQPVIHRDISPDNILLLGDQPKIIDFSVAALGECEKPGEVVGKPAYVSVKQFQGIIQRSNDIYSLGATLFYLLTGSDPEPVSQSSPSDGAPDIPAELDELVKRCTSVDSKSQIDSVEEVLLTLEALAESLLPVVEPANSG